MLTTHMYQPVTECVWTEGMNNLFPETQYRQQKCNNKTKHKIKAMEDLSSHRRHVTTAYLVVFKIHRHWLTV